MTPGAWLRSHGFKRHDEQPNGATDYVGWVGIFCLRVRVPLERCQTQPALWVGFSVGGPLVERQSTVRYRDSWALVEDAQILRRVFAGH